MKTSPERYDDRRLLTIYGLERRDALERIAWGFMITSPLVAGSGLLPGNGLWKLGAPWALMAMAPSIGLWLAVKQRSNRRDE